ncbi:MAG: ScyD/ScyE family protein, partial [Acidobacteria bacterium]|nr:ScyD/ScyE family protein [Acidobacteriota bacterium]
MARAGRLVWNGLVTAAFSVALVATAAAQTPPTVMATGLDNPRGLALGPDGHVYVVEAGRGGTTALCLPNPGGAPGTRCYGPSGGVTRITGVGQQQRVLAGLPSLAGPTGADATGPHDLDFAFGYGFITVGSGGDPALLAPFKAAGIQLGTLLAIDPTGAIIPAADAAAFEAANNPAGGPLDSNLYGLTMQANRAVMTDAGGNSLLQVDTTQTVRTLAVFPTRQVVPPGGGLVDMESVPTSIAEGPDGTLYVGELTGFPFPAGGANVYAGPAGGGLPVVAAT